MNKKKVVVLLSGGMDSTVAFYDSINNHDVVGAISFHYGSKHNDNEIPCATYHTELMNIKHKVVFLDFVGELFESDLLKKGGEVPKGHYEEASMKSTVVPFRNGIMLSAATGYAESKGANGLIIAAHAGDHAIYPDCREDFMKAMGVAMMLGTYAHIELLRPFIAMTKAEICQRGSTLGVDYMKTWSCYVGGDVHCGECGTCVERREAFMLAGINDPTEYMVTGPLPTKPLEAA